MKISNIISIILIGLVFIGCTNKEPEVITRTETQLVEVPVKPLRPKIDCSFTGTGNEPIGKLLDCVILQKRIIEQLTQDKYE